MFGFLVSFEDAMNISIRFENGAHQDAPLSHAVGSPKRSVVRSPAVNEARNLECSGHGSEANYPSSNHLSKTFTTLTNMQTPISSE